MKIFRNTISIFWIIKIMFLILLDSDIAISDFRMRILWNISFSTVVCEHKTPRKYLCARVRASRIRVCVRIHARLLRGSLIFISKNFFNKKVARFLLPRPPPSPSPPSPPCFPPALPYNDGFSYRQVCISYVRERRG